MGMMFGRKYKQENQQLKQAFAEFEAKVTEQNELNRIIYDFLSTGMALGKDSKLKEYVKEGYEGNPDIFSIVIRLAGMFANVPQRLVEVKSDGTQVDVQDKDIARIMYKPNYYQSWNEYKRAWAIFYYITGNSIVYAPRLPAGLNAGKLTNDGLLMMPSQNVTIRSKSWREPVGFYTLDMNEQYKIDATDIWHERFAPTLNYNDGSNFMGMSPIKVAADITNSQNKGYAVTAKIYNDQHPPGIVYKEGDGETTAEQESKFRERYKTKYSGINNFTTPIFTMGKVGFTKIGFDNLQELQIIEMSEHGLRVFCNLLQVPSELFGDTKGSTYNNKREASKAIYTHRVMPDQTAFCEGLSEIFQAYGPYKLIPDYSDIECLQEDKKLKSEWVSKAFNDSVLTGDEYLALLGLEETGLPEMQVRYINANRIPLNLSEDGIIESDKYYETNKIPEAL